MRLLKILFPLVLVLAYGCGPDTTQLQESLETLTVSWEKEDKEVINWVEMIESSNRDWVDTLNNYRLSDEVRGALKPAMRMRYDSLMTQSNEVTKNYGKLRKEADGFMESWSRSTKELSTLRASLAEKKVDVSAISEKIENLNRFLNATPGNIGTWKILWDHMEETKPLLMTKFAAFNNQLAPPPPPVPATVPE